MGTLQIYALLTRAPLFHGIGHKALIGCAVNMAGYVPPAWQAWWDSNDHLSLTDDAETYWLQSRECIREGCSDDEDTDAAIILLRRGRCLPRAASTLAFMGGYEKHLQEAYTVICASKTS